MKIERNLYLRKLADCRHNGMIKVITGMRRCGKSYLLFRLFREYLLQEGIDKQHIIQIAFDIRRNTPLRNPDKLCAHVESQIKDSGMYYILLDEVQMLEDFESVLNEFLHYDNVDVYVTGSNSKFLSSDIITEFRGRGYEIHIQPLSFAEYLPAHGGAPFKAWEDYLRYGGLPFLLSLRTDEQKSNYLKSLFEEVYKKDILERNKVRYPSELESVIDILSSAVGSLTNPYNLSKSFLSLVKKKIAPATIARYCKYLEEAFLVSKAKRYDIKGKCYISTPFKYYFEDIGLRNAHLNFRQNEENHLMENIIYNELRLRGYNVDVGVIGLRNRDTTGKQQRTELEVDFVANQGSRRYYLQSAFRIYDDAKREQENRPLRQIADSFKKIIVTGEYGKPWHNNDGFLMVNIHDFLLNPRSMEL
ncbi:MAG: ATP-binding protein [Lentisphaerae bacterium]|jgi:predicted AAA+ superfamily ATPase|nr:ATP-binding protein [Lentisphaerota bacterium]